MKNKILQLALLLSFIGYGCANESDNDRYNVSKYLDEAKACYSGANPLANKDLMPSENVRAKLGLIDIKDYVGERAFKSGELIIQFRKNMGVNVFSIDLEISDPESSGCAFISVYEVLQ